MKVGSRSHTIIKKYCCSKIVNLWRPMKSKFSSQSFKENQWKNNFLTFNFFFNIIWTNNWDEKLLFEMLQFLKSNFSFRPLKNIVVQYFLNYYIESRFMKIIVPYNWYDGCEDVEFNFNTNWVSNLM